MKILPFLVVGLFLNFGCKPEKSTTLTDKGENVEEIASIEPIEPEIVEEIVEEKVKKAKTAEDAARDRSPFKGMSCDKILKNFEKDILSFKQDTNNKTLEKEIMKYSSDIISNRDCVSSDRSYAKTFGKLKKELATIKSSIRKINDTEADEY